MVNIYILFYKLGQTLENLISVNSNMRVNKNGRFIYSAGPCFSWRAAGVFAPIYAYFRWRLLLFRCKFFIGLSWMKICVVPSWEE